MVEILIKDDAQTGDNSPQTDNDETRKQQLTSEIEITMNKLQASEESNTRMFKIIGGDHVQRDLQRMHVAHTDGPATFPDGIEITEKYKWFAHLFKHLYPDMIVAIKNLGSCSTEEAETYLIKYYLQDIYNTCYKHVFNRLEGKKMSLVAFTRESNDIPIPLDGSGSIVNVQRLRGRIPNFWYDIMQDQAMMDMDEFLGLMQPKPSNDKTANQLSCMIHACPSHILELHDMMKQLHKQGEIEYSSTTILTLVDKLAEFLVYAVLSDPPCYLYPAPGEEVPFASTTCEYIQFSSSTKRIPEGKSCVALFPGLFYRCPLKTSTSQESVEAVINAHATILHTALMDVNRPDFLNSKVDDGVLVDYTDAVGQDCLISSYPVSTGDNDGFISTNSIDVDCLKLNPN